MEDDSVRRLAHWLWQQRGKPSGSPDADWFRAEELLAIKREQAQQARREVMLFALGVEGSVR